VRLQAIFTLDSYFQVRRLQIQAQDPENASMQLIHSFLPALALLAFALMPSSSFAQQKIELEGRASRVDGTRIELYEGLIALEARDAEFEADYKGPQSVSDLTSGTAVEIVASIQPNGSISASHIEINDEKNPDNSIAGLVSAMDQAAHAFTIGPVSIFFDYNTRLKKLSAIQNETFVQATLELSGGRLRASMVERENPDDD